jgi:hypothetical protein
MNYSVFLYQADILIINHNVFLYQADILIINHNVFLYHADILIINHSVFLFPLCGIMSYRSLVELSRLRDGIMYNFQSNTFVNHRNQGSV